MAIRAGASLVGSMARASAKTIWLTGYDVDTFSPHKRKKLVQWVAEKKLDTPELFILCKDASGKCC
jgi:hypothetical protein